MGDVAACLKRLVEEGCDVGRGALFCAALTGAMDVLTWIRRKADPQLQLCQASGWDASVVAEAACMGGRAAVLDWLERKQARAPRAAEGGTEQAMAPAPAWACFKTMYGIKCGPCLYTPSLLTSVVCHCGATLATVRA